MTPVAAVCTALKEILKFWGRGGGGSVGVTGPQCFQEDDSFIHQWSREAEELVLLGVASRWAWALQPETVL